MSPAPSVIVFDVNETLSDMGPMAQRFTDVGAPGHLARLWFTTLLRDAFALTAAGGQRPFAELAVASLRTVLHGVDLDRELPEAVDHVMTGFSRLGLHPDVAEGVRALRRSGLRLATLSNGSAAVAERLLTDSGLRAEFEALLSVEQAGAWKPARAAYEHAARSCGVDLADMMMVAVHPWDVDGAARAGMSTAWIDRDGAPYPDFSTPPTVTADSLTGLAAQLAGDGSRR